MASLRVARPASPRVQVALALGIVYIIWGSTYLSIRIAIQTIPPLLMAGARFLIAGLLISGFALVTRAVRPSRRQIVSASIVGLLLPAAGNGTVVWAEQYIPSGLAALLVALVPLWMVLLDWGRPGGRRPPLLALGGVVVGFFGVALLALHGGGSAGQSINPLALVVVGASFCWAAGSIFSHNAELPASAAYSTGIEMLAGGAVLLIFAGITGEGAHLHLRAISGSSVLAMLYLILFGSLVGYTAFVWLLKSAPPTLVSTYAYVNPVVAVFLGWLILGETVTPITIVAAAIIVAAVALITSHQGREEPEPSDAPVPAEPEPVMEGAAGE